MSSLQIVLLLLQLLGLFAFQSVTAWWGNVTFYNNFRHDDSGGSYTYSIGESQQCINLSCYDNKASSIKWSGLADTGAYDGKARIAFYMGGDCKGALRDWPIDAPNGFPGNLSQSHIDNKISSFMIWQLSDSASGTTLPCQWKN